MAPPGAEHPNHRTSRVAPAPRDLVSTFEDEKGEKITVEDLDDKNPETTKEHDDGTGTIIETTADATAVG